MYHEEKQKRAFQEGGYSLDWQGKTGLSGKMPYYEEGLAWSYLKEWMVEQQRQNLLVDLDLLW